MMFILSIFSLKFSKDFTRTKIDILKRRIIKQSQKKRKNLKNAPFNQI